MTPWQWWATSASGRDDGEWELGEFDTRDEAVREGNLEYQAGEPFYIIEARTSTAAKYATGNHDIVPFVRRRNEERLVAVANGETPTPGPAIDQDGGERRCKHGIRHPWQCDDCDRENPMPPNLELPND